MSFLANTMFEVSNSNISRNNLQNVAGKFGSFADEVFTGADCSAGTLVVPNGLLPNEGYTGILNGNAHYMVLATDGTSGSPYGDHTGIYAFNSYNVSQATANNGSGNVWNVGFETLGLGLPAGERGDFTEIIIGETYAMGIGNFSTAPTTETSGYATISNGYLVFSSSAPAEGTGVYFEVLRTAPVTEGAEYWGDKYFLKAVRAKDSYQDA